MKGEYMLPCRHTQNYNVFRPATAEGNRLACAKTCHKIHQVPYHLFHLPLNRKGIIKDFTTPEQCRLSPK
jgi:hypothetical protein